MNQDIRWKQSLVTFPELWVYGLSHHRLKCLKKIIKSHLEQGAVILYGSRAKDTQKPYGGADLVVKKAVPYGSILMEIIRAGIADSDFPYLCDIQLFEEMRNQELIGHIERAGIRLFEINMLSA